MFFVRLSRFFSRFRAKIVSGFDGALPSYSSREKLRMSRTPGEAEEAKFEAHPTGWRGVYLPTFSTVSQLYGMKLSVIQNADLGDCRHILPWKELRMSHTPGRGQTDQMCLPTFSQRYK